MSQGDNYDHIKEEIQIKGEVKLIITPMWFHMLGEGFHHQAVIMRVGGTTMGLLPLGKITLWETELPYYC